MVQLTHLITSLDAVAHVILYFQGVGVNILDNHRLEILDGNRLSLIFGLRQA